MENLQEQKSKSQQLEELLEGIWKQNPIFVMALGMCPTLAVTVSAINSLAMGLATTFVLISSCLLIFILYSQRSSHCCLYFDYCNFCDYG